MGFAEENIHEVSILDHPNLPRQSSAMKAPGYTYRYSSDGEI